MSATPQEAKDKETSPTFVMNEYYYPFVERIVGGHAAIVALYGDDSASDDVRNKVLTDIDIARALVLSHMFGVNFADNNELDMANGIGRAATILFTVALAHRRHSESGKLEDNDYFRVADGMMQRVRAGTQS
jgi:hypothetical protein